MTYAELAEAQYRRSKQFAEAQTDVMSVYCDAERDLKELQAENAKLRELVREIWRCAKCSHRLDNDDEVWCDVSILMEKLGVIE